MTTQKTLIYLHGFLSSPQSQKAQSTLRYLQQHSPSIDCIIPQLSYSPAEAIRQINVIADKCECPVFIGSSLGGYYAHYAATQYRTRAVLINPAVKPYELLEDYLGEHRNPYTQSVFTLTPEHIDALRRLEVSENKQMGELMVLLQTGDEVLDYHLAASRFKLANCYIEQGGDHSFTSYKSWLPKVFEFLKLAN